MKKANFRAQPVQFSGWPKSSLADTFILRDTYRRFSDFTYFKVERLLWVRFLNLIIPFQFTEVDWIDSIRWAKAILRVIYGATYRMTWKQSEKQFNKEFNEEPLAFRWWIRKQKQTVTSRSTRSAKNWLCAELIWRNGSFGQRTIGDRSAISMLDRF